MLGDLIKLVLLLFIITLIIKFVLALVNSDLKTALVFGVMTVIVLALMVGVSYYHIGANIVNSSENQSLENVSSNEDNENNENDENHAEYIYIPYFIPMFLD